MKTLVFIFVLAVSSTTAFSQVNGHFVGEVVTRWISDPNAPDREMQVLEEFAYKDALGHVWTVPKNTVVNGASIPSFLWTIIGPPFVGDYRRASVVHDYFCQEDVRSGLNARNAKDVHRMFYYASLADGLGKLRAKTMYAGVYWMGPWWGGDSPSECFAACHFETPEYDVRTSFSEERFQKLEKWIEEKDPSLEEIEQYIGVFTHVGQTPPR